MTIKMHKICTIPAVYMDVNTSSLTVREERRSGVLENRRNVKPMKKILQNKFRSVYSSSNIATSWIEVGITRSTHGVAINSEKTLLIR
jgi:hypothetical protein